LWQRAPFEVDVL